MKACLRKMKTSDLILIRTLLHVCSRAGGESSPDSYVMTVFLTDFVVTGVGRTERAPRPCLVICSANSPGGAGPARSPGISLDEPRKPQAGHTASCSRRLCVDTRIQACPLPGCLSWLLCQRHLLPQAGSPHFPCFGPGKDSIQFKWLSSCIITKPAFLPCPLFPPDVLWEPRCVCSVPACCLAPSLGC